MLIYVGRPCRRAPSTAGGRAAASTSRCPRPKYVMMIIIIIISSSSSSISSSSVS